MQAKQIASYISPTTATFATVGILHLWESHISSSNQKKPPPPAISDDSTVLSRL